MKKLKSNYKNVTVEELVSIEGGIAPIFVALAAGALPILVTSCSRKK